MENKNTFQQQNPIKDLRQERGLAIAKNYKITKRDDKTWLVPSQSNSNNYYFVKSNGHGATCNCPDCKKNGKGHKCKHIFAVEYIVTHTINELGEIVEQKIEKKTYTQNWSAYNKAQKEEKEYFLKFLNDLVKNISIESYNFGRPKSPIQDILYSMIFKVYSGVSGRRFTTDMKFSFENSLISKEVPFTTLKDYFNKKEITKILLNLIKLSSMPLKEVETDFSIDSSGFGTSILGNWSKYKHSTQDRYKKWLKCHIVTGVKTNIISAVNITSEFCNDCPELKELLEKTNEVFKIEEFSGDKAYISKENLEVINNVGAKPFIPFKSNVSENSTHKNGMVWKKTLHYFLFNQDEFMEHYHKRSNAESSFHMVKSKFGDKVKAKNWTAQVNEVLCKIVCHNIYVLIMEMETLGIDINLILNENSATCTKSLNI
jgi:transposase